MININLKDYCTFWFENIGNIYIGGCCRAHDYAYEKGLPRFQADIDLGTCVADLGAPLIGFGMSIVVMLVGWTRYKKGKQNENLSIPRITR